ncbi:hypothetical protein LCGC14_2665670 [marine sediment metagenome]|uniref:Uncharacterized protein n=1 Tax=marine sediment metagenome TaxID=412755 RepID=A0A0F9C0R6_9ZZZZ
MLQFHSTSSESHKATFQTVIKWHFNFAASLTMVIYRTNRVAGEQIINVVSLEIMSPDAFSGSSLIKGIYVLNLTVPEAHAAYQVFLNGSHEDLEVFLICKIKEHLKIEETLKEEGTTECKSQPQASSSESSSPEE